MTITLILSIQYFDQTRSVYVTNKAFVYVPFWVETVLNRNSLPLSTCLDYSKLRQILSLEDMSGLLGLQDIKSLTREESDICTGTLFSMWTNSVTDAQRAEFTQAVVPMSRSTELKIENLKRLEEVKNTSIGIGLTNQVEKEDEPIYYKMVDIGGATNAVVIYKGFQAFISEPNNEYLFVVDQLKIFYVYLKAYQVSLLPLFKKYLRLLAYKTQLVG